MCDPVTIVGLALSAASTYMQQQSAEAQADHANKIAEAEAANATQATLNDYQQSALRDIEEQQAASQESRTAAEEARAARATARVASGEAGVSGLSIDALEREYAAQNLRNQDVITSNLAMRQRQSAQDRKAINTTGRSRVNQAAASQQLAPSRLGAALQIGAAGLNPRGIQNKQSVKRNSLSIPAQQNVRR